MTIQQILLGQSAAGGGGGATYFNDFSGGTLSDWTLTQNVGGTSYAITGGELVASGGSGNQSYLTYDPLVFADGYVEATFMRADQNSLLFRATDLNNCYVLSVRDGSSSLLPNSYAVFKIVGGVTTTIQGNSALAPWTRGTPRLFRFEMTGTNYKVFDSGLQIISSTDTSLTSGKAGVNVYGALANGWDDFAIQT